MPDLSKWKPWYARIPGAMVGTVGAVGMLILIVPMFAILLLFVGSLMLMDVGLDMMKREE